MLYPRAMGAAFGDLPAPLQAFHAIENTVFYRGEVEVSHGNAIGRAVAGAGGMPRRAGVMPFGFRATRDGDCEIWERNFDGQMTRSKQWLHAPGVIAEQVGTSLFLMEPVPHDGQLHIPIRGVTGFGLPVPGWVMRSCEGVEGVDAEGRVTFDVHARVLGLGLIVRYRGTIAAVP